MWRALRPPKLALIVFLGLLWASIGPLAAQTPPPEYSSDVQAAARAYAEMDRWVTRFQTGQATAAQADAERDRLLTQLQNFNAKYRSIGIQPQFQQDYQAIGNQVLDAERQQRAATREANAPTWGDVATTYLILAAIAAIPIGLVALFLWRIYRGFIDWWRPVSNVPPLTDNFGAASYFDTIGTMPTKTWLYRGIFLGKSSSPEYDRIPLDRQPGAPVCTTPENHTLIVARTRTGKGTRVIIPTLLRYAGSAVVIDPKGENAAITANPREFTGLAEAVHVLNPWGELASVFAKGGIRQDTYNPLDVLDRDDPNSVAVAQSLAAAICPSSPGDKDRYWQGSAANVLTAVLLWIADQPGETKTLGRAREIISLSRKEFTDKYLAPMAASSAFGGAIREMVSPYLDLAQETYSGIMANLGENTKFLSDPQIKAATATSSFALTDLIAERRTVYLVIPPDRIDTQRTWLRIMLAALSHTYRRAPLEGRPPHRCLVMIDEFPALGRIEDMPRDIATMSGYGIDYMLVTQGVDQIRDLYGQAANTLLSNCAYKWFCNVSDLDSARYLSETLGKKTVRTVGVSESESGTGTTYGETGRALLTPDEVMSLGREIAIALHPLGRPHYLRPVDYWNLATVFGHLHKEHPQAYWEPPLVYDPNPYFQGGAVAS